MRVSRAITAVLVAVCVLAGAVWAAPAFPALSGRVVDGAGLLSDQARERIAALSGEHEKQTGHQVVVATVKSTDGYEIEQYANALYRTWGLGDKKKNDGVLLLVSMSPKRVRIEVGYGLEGDLTDLQSKLIITNTIAPAFKKGDYDAGLTDATIQIMRTIGGKPSGADAVPILDQQPAEDQGGGIPIAAIIILLAVFGRFFWPLLFLGGIGGGRGGFGGGGFGGGGFGGGGFSGGGGSSGGGGASGSW
jgi:uncharacterized protein